MVAFRSVIKPEHWLLIIDPICDRPRRQPWDSLPG
jgi:hypothetical protein